LIKAHGGASMTKSIPLTHGKFALIDDEDFEKLNQYKWRFHGGYAVTKISGVTTYMQWVVFGRKQGFQVDHISRDTLDNRKSNLRHATKAQNGINRGANKNNTSGFKGVSWNKSKNKWDSQIAISGKHVLIGRFTKPEEAARAYDEAALKYFGEFAYLNFPKVLE
jgi:hypothetical protein